MFCKGIFLTLFSNMGKTFTERSQIYSKFAIEINEEKRKQQEFFFLHLISSN